MCLLWVRVSILLNHLYLHQTYSSKGVHLSYEEDGDVNHRRVCREDFRELCNCPIWYIWIYNGYLLYYSFWPLVYKQRMWPWNRHLYWILILAYIDSTVYSTSYKIYFIFATSDSCFWLYIPRRTTRIGIDCSDECNILNR